MKNGWCAIRFIHDAGRKVDINKSISVRKSAKGVNKTVGIY